MGSKTCRTILVGKPKSFSSPSTYLQLCKFTTNQLVPVRKERVDGPGNIRGTVDSPKLRHRTALFGLHGHGQVNLVLSLT